MNHVFLSGVAHAAPLLVSAPAQTPHAIMSLTVTHRTATGLEKKEQYPISAWRGIAQRMVSLIKAG